MRLKSLKLNNFKLFPKEELSFGKTNIIRGENYSGKTTILKAIIFALYGNASGTKLKRLISFGEKSTTVELETDEFKIVRSVPNELHIYEGEIEIQFNTTTLKQAWIDKKIGDYTFFQKYRLINKNSINLLDYAKDTRSIVTLRKELMAFIDADFSDIRKSLLNKKLERETYNIDKKLYTFYISKKRENILINAKETFSNQINKFKEEQKTLLKKQSELSGKIRSIDYIIKNNKDVAEQIKTKKCPTCGTILGTKKIAAIKGKSKEEIDKLAVEKKEYEKSLNTLLNDLAYVEDNLQVLNIRYEKISSALIKLKAAKKFVDYRYTRADVELYTAAIKVLDNFSGWYIQKWLNNLTYIINDLLKEIGLSVIFSADKQFLTIIENGRELDYNDLSGGQGIFLSVIFKLAILLQNGITRGIIILDEGLNELKLNNLHKLLDILKSLPYQVFLIYQNIDEIKDVKMIQVKRENNISKIL